jgi:hypothetical protein
MGKDYESWAPSRPAYFSDGAAPDDPGPSLEPKRDGQNLRIDRKKMTTSKAAIGNGRSPSISLL